MEKDIVPKLGIKYIPIEIYGFSKTKIIRDIKNIRLIYKDIKKCKKIMEEFQPDVVIGVGGYVTYPVIRAAHSLRILYPAIQMSNDTIIPTSCIVGR